MISGEGEFLLRAHLMSKTVSRYSLQFHSKHEFKVARSANARIVVKLCQLYEFPNSPRMLQVIRPPFLFSRRAPSVSQINVDSGFHARERTLHDPFFPSYPHIVICI